MNPRKVIFSQQRCWSLQQFWTNWRNYQKRNHSRNPEIEVEIMESLAMWGQPVCVFATPKDKKYPLIETPWKIWACNWNQNLKNGKINSFVYDKVSFFPSVRLTSNTQKFSLFNFRKYFYVLWPFLIHFSPFFTLRGLVLLPSDTPPRLVTDQTFFQHPSPIAPDQM